ncbi:MAG: GFA family protein [Acidobacteriaceae bacterium]|nr:GFA family protein [Acidobacteriaceae bacterium]
MVESVDISGAAKEFVRLGASGEKVHTYFCPTCGSTVYWKADVVPSLIGVAVGSLTDPDFPAPNISVFEQSKHGWVQIAGAVEHFQQSALQKNRSEIPPRSGGW